jgi:recombination protein RecA
MDFYTREKSADSYALSIPPVISTGSLRLDAALGIGGIPCGQIIEISGPMSSGKTGLCQQIMAESQKLGGICAIVDADQTWDAGYSRQCGVDLDRIIVATSSRLETALNTLKILAESGALTVIALDSISALYPGDGDIFPSGNQDTQDADSRLTKILRSVSNAIRKNGTIVLITKLTTRPGGAIYHELASHPSRLSLQLYAAVRLKLRSIRLLKKEGVIIGRKIQVTAIKNKFNTCQQITELDIMYQNGILKIQ